MINMQAMGSRSYITVVPGMERTLGTKLLSHTYRRDCVTRNTHHGDSFLGRIDDSTSHLP